jgi:hypothetical protein
MHKPVYMPEVDTGDNFAKVLATARAGTPDAEHAPGEKPIAIITPGRLMFCLACPPAGSVSQQMVDGVRAVVPDEDPQTISAIAFTDVVQQGALDAVRVNELIPFTGSLLGMAYLGHNVVVFEGHHSALSLGCRDADLLIVDEAMANHLQDDWGVTAARVMRKPRILLFHRNGRLAVIDPSTAQWPKSEAAAPKKKRSWPF